MRLSKFQLQATLLGVVAVFPFLPKASDYLGSGAQAAIFTIVAASLVLLTGWVGQISLAHAAFVGVGAYATGWATTVFGLTFPLSLPAGAAAAAGVAALLGVVALRVRGLYLAVATLIFSWAASEYLFRQNWVLRYGTVETQTIGAEEGLLYLDFSSRFTFYYVAWALAVALLFALSNMRDGKTGRAFYAVRGSEMAAASLGMNVLRYKSLAFALSGAIAGVAGSLTIAHAQVVSADAFDFTQSLFFLAIAVVGGLNSLAGGVAAAIVFAAMSELFFEVDFLNEFLQLFSAALLAVIFRVYPGGLAAMAKQASGAATRATRQLQTLPGRAQQVAIERLDAAAGPEAAGSDGFEPGEDDAVGRLAGWIVAAVRPVGRAFGAVGRGALRLVARRSDDELERPPLLQFGNVRLGDVPAADGTDAPSLPPQPIATDGATEPSANGHGNTGGSDAGTQDPTEPGEQDAAGALRVPLAPQKRERDYDARRRHERRPLIEAENITMRFGGLVAVNDASLTVREGEITALIGPNGAGKTTLFNSIAGFNVPTEGRVKLYGQDVTGTAVHHRAQLGVARTFQLIQLFPELTVFDNLLAATHLQNTTGFLQHMAVTPGAIAAEAYARARVRKVIDMFDLQEVADQKITGLPFGVLRMIEVARSLVMGAPVIMLDEPASGLDERETDELMHVLEFTRDLGATLLLIEHDVRMVTAVSDYMYVLERGQMIAEGTPAEIQRNPDVIAAYLGGAVEEEPEAAEQPPGASTGSAVELVAGPSEVH